MARLSNLDFAAQLSSGYETIDVEIEDLGIVGLKALSSNECVTYQKMLMKGPQNIPQNYQLELVKLCVVDDEGQRVFKTKDDFAMLGAQSAKFISKLWDKCMELNGLSTAASEEAVKNSVTTVEGASSSDSPSPSA